MDISIIVNAFVLAAVGGLLSFVTYRVRSDVRDVRTEVVQVRTELTARIDAVEAKLAARIEAVEEKLTRRIERVEAGLDAVRSDITQLALALGTHPQAENG